VSGINLDEAKKLIEGKKATPVIVAVIDGGTETSHSEIAPRLWINTDEIADNGIDDDRNGYIDDIHGWNFIGGKTDDVVHDNLEFTRIYKELKQKYEGKQASDIAPAQLEEFRKYERFAKEYEQRLTEATEEQMGFEQFMAVYKLADMTVKKTLGKQEYTLEDVQGMEGEDDFTVAIKEILTYALTEDIVSQIDEIKSHFSDQFEYSYNLNFDPRSVVGDNYNDPTERFYGNNRCYAPKADHGTHVSGIIGALNDGKGAEGICKDALIMPIRCVPNGDERDKDVANAIRYAVDNGARIINMSFGKSYSPHKTVVDEAIKYAESKGVLMIHAAGNDSKNVDVSANFPTPFYDGGGKCSTWITVGASSHFLEELAADFTNYGKKKVDVFAPGVNIYSTYPTNSHKKESGTSMAAPVTSGVAAFILSYYPELSAKQLKAIIEKSVVKYKVKVPMPGNPEKKVKFNSLSKTGGVINLSKALTLAEKTTAK
jgi:subtilisin family serine protease